MTTDNLANNRDQSTTNAQNPNRQSGNDPVESRRDVGSTNQSDSQAGQVANAQPGMAQPKVALDNVQGQQVQISNSFAE